MNNKFFKYLLAICGGILGVFAFSPFDYSLVAYLSIFILLFNIQTNNQKQALICSYLWAVAFFTFGLNWISVSVHEFGNVSTFITYVVLVCLALYLSLYPLLFTYIMKKFAIQSSTLIASVWFLTELLRAWVFTGFPWLNFGYSQTNSNIAWIASFFGVYGITFFMFWITSFLYNIGKTSTTLMTSKIAKKSNLLFLNLASVFVVVVVIILINLANNNFHNANQYTANNTKKISISLLQGNIEQRIKWNPEQLQHSFDVYNDLIRKALPISDLVILPETALPFLENNLQESFMQPLDKSIQTQSKNIILGTIYQSQNNEIFNSATVLGNLESKLGKVYTLDHAERYNKNHLVPFGEYTPLSEYLKPIASKMNIFLPEALNKGDYIQKNLILNNIKIDKPIHVLLAICYEIISGEQIRKNLTKDTDFILTISNDAWFGRSIGPWQHLQIARMRAIETGKYVLRATNNGVTTVINPAGDIVKIIPQFQENILNFDLPIITNNAKFAPRATGYSVLGYIPLYLIIFLCLVIQGTKFLMSQLILRANRTINKP